MRINSIVPHSGQHLNLGSNRLDYNNSDDRQTIETHLIHTDVNMKESLENFRNKYNLDKLNNLFEPLINYYIKISSGNDDIDNYDVKNIEKSDELNISLDDKIQNLNIK